jgi:hypothetical protein
MKGCLEGHRKCNKRISDGSWWPSRLLEVGNFNCSFEIRLRETAETPPTGSQYVTLSHCWGKATFLTLTTENLEVLKAGFFIKDLPLTFQDAIGVARRLNVPYLWIDSLCIVQNSLEDWSREASQMSNVYQHGFCNIAATGALDSAEGLFLDRKMDPVPPFKILIPYKDTRNPRVVYVTYPDLWKYGVEDSPLIKRAWVLQERLLARRVLHFGRHQLFWECREHATCETYGTQAQLHLSRSIEEVSPKADFDVDVEANFKGGRRTLEHVWERIVRTYSLARLTKLSDKEAAINGIIKFLEEAFEDICVVGLWKNRLLQQLLWQAVEPSRSIANRAPSWSCKSSHVLLSNLCSYPTNSKAYTHLMSPILPFLKLSKLPAKFRLELADSRIVSGLSIEGEVQCYGPYGRVSRYGADYYSTTQLEDLSIRRESGNPLSSVTTGSIKLKGLLNSATLTMSPFADLTIDSLPSEKVLCYIDDTESQGPLSAKSWCMLVRLEFYGSVYGEGLVLQPKSEGVYERVGKVNVSGDSVWSLISKTRRTMIEKRRTAAGKSTVGDSFIRMPRIRDEGDESSSEDGSSEEMEDSWEDVEEQSIIIV